MHTNVHTRFIKKYWFNIVKTESGFYLFNTKRGRNQTDRDGIGYVVPDSECATFEEALKSLDRYEKSNPDVDR